MKYDRDGAVLVGCGRIGAVDRPYQPRSRVSPVLGAALRARRKDRELQALRSQGGC